MKRTTLYMIAVIAMAAALVFVKQRTNSKPIAPNFAAPAVVLVADLREADSPRDTCAEIIRAVREARGRGINVAELMPDSDSPMLKGRHITISPTVLILDKNGRELNRFEGESVATLNAVRSRLREMQGSGQ